MNSSYQTLLEYMIIWQHFILFCNLQEIVEDRKELYAFYILLVIVFSFGNGYEFG